MTDCTQCGSPAKFFFRTADRNRKLTGEQFDYFRCRRCGLIFLSPVPADLGAYYPPNYYEIPKSESELASRAATLHASKLDVVQRHVTRGKLLEIGPAYGLFAHLAKQAGFDVSVIERDARCCAFLRDTVKVDVVESDDPVKGLRDLPPLDVIVLWQVVEHLPDPWSVLEAAARRLRPGGVLILDTPNPSAFQFRVLGRFWTHVDAPRHVTMIPAALLVERMGTLGLPVLSLTSCDRIATGYNGFGWAETFKSFLSNERWGRAAHVAGRVLAKLLIPIERTGFRGSTYTAVFRKGAAQ
ncbi:MAG TPA: class I SAM-dependent methyltransferase [Caldimonas sp.]|jgi:SAM-dependent methyltransferase|nr:class I SAM-dependent methyltransferase [Caldimonas sp.]HEX2542305.1 class I SAM-dependent methyltransferase [Caldimonas sp.]